MDGVKEIKLIAVYARVSTSNQEEENTIETQLVAVREFAAKNNYTIVKEYIDEGWSGDILARPQLDQLRNDAKKKIWEAVLAYDPDRLARRYSYQELVMDELKEVGIEILFVTTPSPKNGEEKILHGVKGLFAEYERVKITERFRLGKLRKVKEGHVLTSEGPYGYTYVPKKGGEHGYFEINDEEAKVLKSIFSWIADEGLTVRAVVRRLQELNIKPRRSKRGVWSVSTLTHLLRNRAYIGEAHYGKSYAVVPERPLTIQRYRKIKKSSRKIKPENEWIKIPVPAIIEASLFNRVQERLRLNFELSKRNRKNHYLLAGRIWCVCGNRRVGEGPQRGKFLYYRCINKVLNFPLPKTCFEMGVNARVADQLIWEKIVELMSSKDLLAEQLERWLDKQKNEERKPLIDREQIQSEIAKLKEKEERYTNAYGAGIFSLERLKEYLLPVREKITALETQIVKSQLPEEPESEWALPTMDDLERVTINAQKTLSDLNFEAKQEIVRGVINKVVATQRELCVSGFIPVASSNNVALCPIDRYRWYTMQNSSEDQIRIPFQINIPIPKMRRGRIVVSDNSSQDEVRIAA